MVIMTCAGSGCSMRHENPAAIIDWVLPKSARGARDHEPARVTPILSADPSCSRGRKVRLPARPSLGLGVRSPSRSNRPVSRAGRHPVCSPDETSSGNRGPGHGCCLLMGRTLEAGRSIPSASSELATGQSHMLCGAASLRIREALSTAQDVGARFAFWGAMGRRSAIRCDLRQRPQGGVDCHRRRGSAVLGERMVAKHSCWLGGGAAAQGTGEHLEGLPTPVAEMVEIAGGLWQCSGVLAKHVEPLEERPHAPPAGRALSPGHLSVAAIRAGFLLRDLDSSMDLASVLGKPVEIDLRQLVRSVGETQAQIEVQVIRSMCKIRTMTRAI